MKERPAQSIHIPHSAPCWLMHINFQQCYGIMAQRIFMATRKSSASRSVVVPAPAFVFRQGELWVVFCLLFFGYFYISLPFVSTVFVSFIITTRLCNRSGIPALSLSLFFFLQGIVGCLLPDILLLLLNCPAFLLYAFYLLQRHGLSLLSFWFPFASSFSLNWSCGLSCLFIPFVYVFYRFVLNLWLVYYSLYISCSVMTGLGNHSGSHSLPLCL